MKQKRKILAALLFLGLLLNCAWAQSPTQSILSSKLSYERIGLGETTTLSVSVQGIQDRVKILPPSSRPEGLDFHQLDPQYSVVDINGTQLTSTTINFLVTPNEKGRFIVEPISVTVQGVEHFTKSHRLEVTDAPTRPQNGRRFLNPWSAPPIRPGVLPNLPLRQRTPRRKRIPKAIWETHLSPKRIYVNQTTIYSGKLLTLGDYRAQPEPTFMPGIIAVPLPSTQGQEVRHGENYDVEEVREALFSLNPGFFNLEPKSLSLQRGLLGPIQHLTAKPHTLEVMALPKDEQPESFTGAVGENFEVEIFLDDSHLPAGESRKLTVRVKGAGNLELVPYPHLPEWPGLEVKQQDGDSNLQVIDDELFSERSYVYRLKAKTPGSYPLDGIKFSYFRPSDESYITLDAATLELEVTKNEVSSTAPEDPSLLNQAEAERPVSEPGASSPKALHISHKLLAALSALAILGLLLAIFGGPLKRGKRSSKTGRLPQRPKDRATLQSALSSLAPGRDRGERNQSLSKLDWSEESIKLYDSLWTRCSQAQYGGEPGQSLDLPSMLKDYDQMIKRRRKR